MILVDSSAWIEFLRGTGSPVNRRVRELLETEFVTCEPVRMEVLAGGRDDQHLAELRGILNRGTLVATESEDFEVAASLYRVCRRNGTTPRRLVDCLIAAIAIRAGASILDADADFEAIAAHTALELA